MPNFMLSSICTIQNEIIAEFKTLGEDRGAMLDYVMDLGECLLPLNEAQKVDRNLIKGCISKVWLVFTREKDQLFFEADSDVAIIRGLISLLFRVLSGQSIEAIVCADLYFIERIGLRQLISSQRLGGFASLVQAVKLVAVAQSSIKH